MARKTAKVLDKRRLIKSDTVRPERANRRPYKKQEERHEKRFIQENPN